MNDRYDNDKYEQAYRTIEELNSHGLGDSYVVIKGIALNRILYHEDRIRSFNDLDILISQSDAQRFHDILNSIGYFQTMGPTSTNKSNNSRAFLAFYSKKISEQSHAPFPIKTHQDKVEYKAYVRENSITIEVHDGFHYIPQELCFQMLKNSELLKGTSGEPSYKTLSLEYSFLSLIANAYENSESFYSNSYDYGIKKSDYIDIQNFFKVYMDADIWDNISYLIAKYKLNNMVAIVLNNLRLLCGRDVTNGCLPDVILRDSRWGIDILKRISDPDVSRRAALSVMRTQWRRNGSMHPYYLKSLMPCESKEDVKWSIDILDKKMIIRWIIPKTMFDKPEEFLYQIKVVPVDADTEYTLYKIDFGNYNGEYRAYGHVTEKYTMGAVKKNTKTELKSKIVTDNDMVNIIIKADEKEIGMKTRLNDYEWCFKAEVFFQHYKEYYHSYKKKTIDDELFLRVKNV